jgi:ABC-type branched-subunit amino acid transport system permease subunit
MTQASGDLAPASASSLSWFERLPLRKIVLIVVAVGLGVVIGGGIYKTLTLPAGERLNWSFWANLTVIGLALGAVYALIALGYTLVYGILRMINFAHGEVFMAGAFGSFFFADAYKQSGFLNRQPGLSLVILLVSSMAVSTLIAV